MHNIAFNTRTRTHTQKKTSTLTVTQKEVPKVHTTRVTKNYWLPLSLLDRVILKWGEIKKEKKTKNKNRTINQKHRKTNKSVQFSLVMLMFALTQEAQGEWIKPLQCCWAAVSPLAHSPHSVCVGARVCHSSEGFFFFKSLSPFSFFLFFLNFKKVGHWCVLFCCFFFLLRGPRLPLMAEGGARWELISHPGWPWRNWPRLSLWSRAGWKTDVAAAQRRGNVMFESKQNMRKGFRDRREIKYSPLILCKLVFHLVSFLSCGRGEKNTHRKVRKTVKKNLI